MDDVPAEGLRGLTADLHHRIRATQTAGCTSIKAPIAAHPARESPARRAVKAATTAAAANTPAVNANDPLPTSSAELTLPCLPQVRVTRSLTNVSQP